MSRAELAVKVTVTSAVQHRRLAVLGSPISHSRSPRIHLAAYRELGLNWEYGAIELTERDFDAFFDGLDEQWLGFSVTMPLKRKAFELATTRDAAAEETGVANTLVRSSNGWYALNTDIGGIIASVRGLHLPSLRSAVIFGAGATAMSTVFALTQVGFTEIILCARRPEQADALIQRMQGHSLGKDVTFKSFELSDMLQRKDAPGFLHDADLLVNTLPGEVSASLPVDAQLARATALFDLNYNPWPSPLCQIWQTNGGTFVDGLELLVQQAVLQVRTFVNGTPDAELPNEEALIETMRQASVER